ncbi:MAG: acetyl-CoA C-acetyltransferase [Hydrotalea sp.]|nr:acetyl-CoA C-acetyltransferase [Hydrotalea sp.]
MPQKNKNDVVIVAGKRTAIGSFLGALSPLAAHQLAAPVIAAVLQSAGLSRDKFDQLGEVILGQILTAAQGQGPARQAAMAAGIPQEIPAMGINLLCGSGLKAVAVAHNYIKSGTHNMVVAGGMESMSRAPHAVLMRAGLADAIKMGNGKLVDTMISDALTCAFHHYHMGQTAENVAAMFGITRTAQDEFALTSQHRARQAIDSGAFKNEIVPITIKGKKGDVVFSTDEYPRDTTAEKLVALKPAFVREGGTVTAGNASGINDGAAALLLARRDVAESLNMKPLFTILAHATVGVDPAVMGIGPIAASKQAVEKSGLTIGDIDLVESNEAFAAQSLAVIKELGLDKTRVNINGGAIALGHPVGASGARILVTLMHGLAARGARYGLATLCVGGGMGVAMVIERD